MRNGRKTILLSLLVITAAFAFRTELAGIERFPPPDFESGYVPPETAYPPGRSPWLDVADVAALLAALTLAAYLAIFRRSRRGIVLLALFSTVYFGFFKKGCVCPVGAIGNVSLALAGTGYTIPLAVILSFALPIVFTLFFGRVFCAAVCPLGAVQELVLVRPIVVPRWIDAGLRVIPFFYLGLAVLFAALSDPTSPNFIVCKYDPFVSIFRLAGLPQIVVLTAVFLMASLLIGRPYCRFLCPYGALLSIFARASKRHPSVTPTDCVKCRLCETACPVNAIEKPNAEDEE